MGMFIAPKVILNGLIFLLDSANTKSYSGSGSAWTDLSGNGNNGTLTNAGSILHESGSHFKFNELVTNSTGYVEMGDVLTTSYTKNIWFRTNAANTNHLMSGSGGAGTTAIWCANGERFIAAGHSTNINVGSNAIVVYDSGSSTGLQTWHNACVTYSNTTMKLYINGFLVDTGTDSDPTDTSLHIAGYANASELSGDVAYASLYNRVLTDDEVLKNYNALKGRFRLNTPNPAQTFSVTPASSTVAENDTLTINVATTNVPDVTLFFTNSRTADFPSASDSGSFSLTNGTGSFTVTPSLDNVTEGDETFTVSVRKESTSGTVVQTSSTITITDVSYSITQDTTSIDEDANESVTFTINTIGVADSTTLYWTIQHVSTNSSDFPANSGSFTITSNTGSVTITPTNDTSDENPETFRLQVRVGSTSGQIVRTSSNITIQSSDGKIVCSTLNEMYGFGSFRNKIWMKYNDYGKPLYPSNSKILELGYHKVFGRLTEKMPTSPVLTKVLRRMARVRTDRLKREMTGKPLTFESRLYPTIIRPIFYVAGWLVHKGVLKKYELKKHSRSIKRS